VCVCACTCAAVSVGLLANVWNSESLRRRCVYTCLLGNADLLACAVGCGCGCGCGVWVWVSTKLKEEEVSVVKAPESVYNALPP